MAKISQFILVNIFLINAVCSYKFPTPTIKVLLPQGFEISIPNSPGVQLFAVHANINVPFVTGLEAGQFSIDINEAVNGRWTYTNPTADLCAGDVIHYWLWVQVNGVGHQILFQEFTVPQ